MLRSSLPERRFKGYTYDHMDVTFSYTLDGIAILETLLATEDGRGLERHWSIPEGITLYLITDPQVNSQVTDVRSYLRSNFGDNDPPTQQPDRKL